MTLYKKKKKNCLRIITSRMEVEEDTWPMKDDKAWKPIIHITVIYRRFSW